MLFRSFRVISVEDDGSALQMIWQSGAVSAPFGSPGIPNDGRTAFLDAPDIGVEVLEAERQLIRIEPLGAAPELHALELGDDRSEEHTSELQSLMRISYAVFCLKKKKLQTTIIKVKLNIDNT